MKLINIGFGSLVAAERLISVLSPDSAPIKRMVQDSRERGMLVDASYGRKTKSVRTTALSSSISVPTVRGRLPVLS